LPAEHNHVDGKRQIKVKINVYAMTMDNIIEF
jgi:hypothetical protein